jgi:hypothetical protein
VVARAAVFVDREGSPPRDAGFAAIHRLSQLLVQRQWRAAGRQADDGVREPRYRIEERLETGVTE